MKRGRSIFYGGMFLLFGLFLWGCGSSGSGGSSENIIEGVASKGIISGGMVTVYSVNADGTVGEELGSAETDENGRYSINVGGHNKSAVIEVTGGSYTDEATGVTVNNTRLRAVIPEVNGQEDAAVTPLTEIAVQLAGEIYTLSRINNVNAAVSVLIGGADITGTQPPDINEDLNGATDAEKNYTMILAAISQMIEDGSAADVDDAIAIIKSDLEDDGELAVDGSGAGDLLQDALGNFVASGDNNTGLTEDDITLDEGLVAATDLDSVKFVKSTKEWDTNGDGVAETSNAYTYNASCNIVLDEYGSGGGIVYTYDASGYLIFEQEDDSGDIIENTYTYDANGNRTSEEWVWQPGDSLYAIITYTYDASRNKVLRESDLFGDGSVDSIFTWTYDANGNMLTEDEDSNADGVLFLSKSYTYDSAGKLIVYEKNYISDGMTDWRYTYTYDAAGNMVLEETDLDMNGTVNSRHYYTYDAAGNKTIMEMDVNVDGAINRRQTWSYDVYGNLTRWEDDTNADGGAEVRTTYTWQACTF